MAEEEIKQLQNKRKKLISQQKQEERKKRDRRLYEKGAVFESIFTESKDFTKDEFYQLITFPNIKVAINQNRTIHAGIFLQIIIPYYLIIGGLIFLLSAKIFHFRFCLFLLFNSIVFVCSCGLFFLMCKASEISYLLSDFLETFWIFIFRAGQDPLSIIVIGILNIPAYYICSVISYIILNFIKKFWEKIKI